MFETITSDMRHYQNAGGWCLHPGFWAGATYRFGAWCRTLRPSLARFALQVAYKLAVLPWRIFRMVVIPSGTRIGPGLCLHHPGNIEVSDTAEIGADCTLYHDVTIGRGPVPGAPRIGDRVTIFPGARVLGGIAVGDGAEIGANVVVTRDVPAGAIVVPPAPRVIPRAMVRPLKTSAERAA